MRKKVFTKDFADYIGRSRVTAKLILETLVEEEYLERIGSKPTDPRLHYILSSKMLESCSIGVVAKFQIPLHFQAMPDGIGDYLNPDLSC